MNLTIDEKMLVKQTLAELKMRKFLGMANKCSRCHKTGEFGGIIRQTLSDQTEVMICGYCEHVEEIEK